MPAGTPHATMITPWPRRGRGRHIPNRWTGTFHDHTIYNVPAGDRARPAADRHRSHHGIPQRAAAGRQVTRS